MNVTSCVYRAPQQLPDPGLPWAGCNDPTARTNTCGGVDGHRRDLFKEAGRRVSHTHTHTRAHGRQMSMRASNRAPPKRAIQPASPMPCRALSAPIGQAILSGSRTPRAHLQASSMATPRVRMSHRLRVVLDCVLNVVGLSPPARCMTLHVSSYEWLFITIIIIHHHHICIIISSYITIY